ncbi:hypothetical protein DVH05_014308 [Phytophthora capsici]|nr:hypothetical protein DVH05_014308 [Phytophthora capsici]
MVIQSILFNASAYMKTPKGKLAEPVTSVRVNRYLDSKTGKINAADSVTRIDLHYLSLHEVELTAAPERYTAFKFTLQHTISFETIQEIRSLYRCDCKSFWNTGWMCSHVIAAMAIMKQLSLKAATSLIPVKKASGGQRKVRGALFVDDPTNKTFSKGNLLNKLQKDPLHCLGWRVGSEFTFVEDDGTSEDEFVVGFIRGVRYRHGIAFWCVKFSDKEEKFYEIEEVIDLIITARKEGIDVTNGMKLTAADVWC